MTYIQRTNLSTLEHARRQCARYNGDIGTRPAAASSLNLCWMSTHVCNHSMDVSVVQGTGRVSSTVLVLSEQRARNSTDIVMTWFESFYSAYLNHSKTEFNATLEACCWRWKWPFELFEFDRERILPAFCLYVLSLWPLSCKHGAGPSHLVVIRDMSGPLHPVMDNDNYYEP